MKITLPSLTVALAVSILLLANASADNVELKSEIQTYCSDVTLWKSFANPVLIQDTLRGNNMPNVVGHPDYLDIYESECGITK